MFQYTVSSSFTIAIFPHSIMMGHNQEKGTIMFSIIWITILTVLTLIAGIPLIIDANEDEGLIER